VKNCTQWSAMPLLSGLAPGEFIFGTHAWKDRESLRQKLKKKGW